MLERKDLEILKKINGSTRIISDTHFFHDRVLLFEKSRLDLVLEHPELPEKFIKVIKDFQYSEYQDTGKTYKRLEIISKDLVIFHNEMLIKKWNEVIEENDLIICLGDFAWKGIQEIIPKLNGNKILILGNHDRSGLNSYPNFTVIRGLVEILFLKNGKTIMREVSNENEDNLFSALIMNNSLFSHYPISDYEKEVSNRGKNENINPRIDKLIHVVNEYSNIKFNFHGHTHSRNINPFGEEFGLKYFNCSCEQLNFTPKKLSDFFTEESDLEIFEGN
jgi:calcineurin-like phosphoesterase family protein